MEPGPCPSVTKIVEAMNSLNQKRHNHSESCFTFIVSRRTQEVEIYLTNQGSGLAFFSTDIGHFCQSNVDNEIVVMLGVKDLTNRKLFAIPSSYTISWYTRTWLSTKSLATWRSHWYVAFFFSSNLKSGRIITTGQYMNYQTFSNLQFRPLLKLFFHSTHVNLRNTSGKKLNFCICCYNSSCLDV